MVFSDFGNLFLLIINKLVINPFFIILYETIIVLILIRFVWYLFNG